MSQDFFERHQPVLEKALAAARERGYWSPFSESPSPRNYGETAAQDGQAAFDALLGKEFALTVSGAEGTVGGEVSPFGFALNITYPRVSPERLLAMPSRPARTGVAPVLAPGWEYRWRFWHALTAAVSRWRTPCSTRRGRGS